MHHPSVRENTSVEIMKLYRMSLSHFLFAGYASETECIPLPRIVEGDRSL